MKRSVWSGIIFASALLGACRQESASDIGDVAGAHARAPDKENGASVRWPGEMPKFASVREAISYLEDEANIIGYTSLFSGSEEFEVTLPSGKKVSNWRIDSMFNRALNRFGNDVVPGLIPLLDHEYEHMRLGAGNMLGNIAARNGLGCPDCQHYGPEHRCKEAVDLWWKWYNRNKDKL